MPKVKCAQTTIGGYLVKRFEQLGLQHYFALRGDYNLPLLDEMLKISSVGMITCCNELCMGYLADGYARAKGISAAVVTYGVGGLSIINAVAGAYAEDLPMLVISGGPHIRSNSENRIMHHSIGELDTTYVRYMFAKVTCHTVIIQYIEDAPRLIDEALICALTFRKPVYIQIACHLASQPISAPHSLQFSHSCKTNAKSLEEAIEHTLHVLNSAQSPLLMAGMKLRWHGTQAFRALADKTGYPVAVMPNAKGFFPEIHANFIGIYWGVVSTPGCAESVESSDACLVAGPLFTDYSTTGYTAKLKRKNLIIVSPYSVEVEGQFYPQIAMEDFLMHLANKFKKSKASSLLSSKKITPSLPKKMSNTLTRSILMAHIQQLLDKQTTIAVELGGSWFNGMDLSLPEGARFEIQLQYGSTGWAPCATAGLALADPKRQIICLVGDGSFQMTAQVLSTLIRYNIKTILFVINNKGYVFESKQHSGTYNLVNNWNYAQLVDVFNGEEGKGLGFRVETEQALREAIAKAKKHKGPSLIEVDIAPTDINPSLIKWADHLLAYHARPTHHSGFI